MCHFTYSLLHKYLLNEQARAGFFSGGRDEQTQSRGWVQLSMSFVWMCLPCDWVGILLTPEYLPLNEAEVHIPWKSMDPVRYHMLFNRKCLQKCHLVWRPVFNYLKKYWKRMHFQILGYVFVEMICVHWQLPSPLQSCCFDLFGRSFTFLEETDSDNLGSSFNCISLKCGSYCSFCEVCYFPVHLQTKNVFSMYWLTSRCVQ